MSDNILLEHVAQDLIRDQVLTEGFKAFKELGLKFNEDQQEIIDIYLNSMLEENILNIENDIKIDADDEELNMYINNLLVMILNLTITSFVNWGIALYYKGVYEE